MTRLILIISLIIVSHGSVHGAENAHRCDIQGLNQLTQLHKDRCLPRKQKKDSETCQQLERALKDYLSAFASQNNAFCTRIGHTYGLVIEKDGYYKKKMH